MSNKWRHEFSSVKTSMLNKAEMILLQKQTPMALSVLCVSNIHCISELMGEVILKKVKDLLLSSIESGIEDVYVLGDIDDQSFLLLHTMSSKEVFTSSLSSVFLNLRQHEFIQAYPIFLTYSCGTALIDRVLGARSAYNLASLAVLEARNSGPCKQLFADELATLVTEIAGNMKLAAYFQDAICDKRLSLAFQPIIDARTNEVVLYESLLRVITKKGDLSSAAPFIAIAENSGFIDIVDELVFDMVTAELFKVPEVCLGMNVSSAAADNPAWINKAKKILKNPSIASRLVVEITETRAHRDLNKLHYFVSLLQGMGCRVALDDFGSGYTAFKQLEYLRVDIIKIDGVFVKDMIINHDNQFFVQMMLNCAKAFNMKSVAEFVESEEVARMLVKLGVDYMQGNYFGPAVNDRPWGKKVI